MSLKQGDNLTYERLFTKKDVEDFMEISGYEGKHHIIPNDDGELMTQGLLTATLSNTIGGENDILMYRMEYNLLKPVYSGDKIRCDVTVDELYEKNGKNRINLSFTCINQKAEEVMSGILKGILLDFS